MKMETDWQVSYTSITDSFSHTQPSKANNIPHTATRGGGGEGERQTDRQAGRHTGQIETDRQTETGRQTEREKTERQTDRYRQTDR